MCCFPVLPKSTGVTFHDFYHFLVKTTVFSTGPGTAAACISMHDFVGRLYGPLAFCENRPYIKGRDLLRSKRISPELAWYQLGTRLLTFAVFSRTTLSICMETNLFPIPKIFMFSLVFSSNMSFVDVFSP